MAEEKLNKYQRRRGPSPGRRLLAAMIALDLAVLGWLFFPAPELAYSKTVSEVVADPPNGKVRVRGVLTPHSVVAYTNPCEVRFSLAEPGDSDDTAEASSRLSVRLDTCSVPDQLREVPGVPRQVDVEGEIVRPQSERKSLPTRVVGWLCGDDTKAEARKLLDDEAYMQAELVFSRAHHGKHEMGQHDQGNSHPHPTLVPVPTIER